MPFVLKTIGDHIRKKRLESGLLQKHVAAQLSVTEESITNWENNNTQPQLQHYPAIIAYLGYDPFVMVAETFGQQVRQYRRAYGLSLKNMGALLGVDGSTVWGWEHHQSVPSPRTKRVFESLTAQEQQSPSK